MIRSRRRVADVFAVTIRPPFGARANAATARSISPASPMLTGVASTLSEVATAWMTPYWMAEEPWEASRRTATRVTLGVAIFRWGCIRNPWNRWRCRRAPGCRRSRRRPGRWPARTRLARRGSRSTWRLIATLEAERNAILAARLGYWITSSAVTRRSPITPCRNLTLPEVPKCSCTRVARRARGQDPVRLGLVASLSTGNSSAWHRRLSGTVRRCSFGQGPVAPRSREILTKCREGRPNW